MDEHQESGYKEQPYNNKKKRKEAGFEGEVKKVNCLVQNPNQFDNCLIKSFFLQFNK